LGDTLNGEFLFIEGTCFLQSDCTAYSPLIVEFDLGVVSLTGLLYFTGTAGFLKSEGTMTIYGGGLIFLHCHLFHPEDFLGDLLVITQLRFIKRDIRAIYKGEETLTAAILSPLFVSGKRLSAPSFRRGIPTSFGDALDFCEISKVVANGF
jgi:hypothetical protein